MPRITGYRLRHQGREFELDLVLDDEAIMDGQLKVEIVAKHRPSLEHRPADTAPWHETKATVSYDHAQRSITVDIDGPPRAVIVIAVADLPGAGTMQELNDSFWTTETAEAVENFIQEIPVPDPVVGCLLKAGISVTIGQSITCINKTRGLELSRRQRLRAVLACLGRNAPSMLSRAAGRTLLCWMRLGF